jgi:hypothetical protein
MSTFECTWEEFKKYSREFTLAAPTLNIDELDNMHKGLGLLYLGMKEEMWRHSAAIILNMASRTYLKRELELLE